MAGLALRMPVMRGLLRRDPWRRWPSRLNSFVGEFMTLLGAWQREPFLAVFGAIGLVLAPVLHAAALPGHHAGAAVRTRAEIRHLRRAADVCCPAGRDHVRDRAYPYVLTNLMTSARPGGLAKMTIRSAYTWSQALADLSQIAAHSPR